MKSSSGHDEMAEGGDVIVGFRATLNDRNTFLGLFFWKLYCELDEVQKRNRGWVPINLHPFSATDLLQFLRNINTHVILWYFNQSIRRVLTEEWNKKEIVTIPLWTATVWYDLITGSKEKCVENSIQSKPVIAFEIWCTKRCVLSAHLWKALLCQCRQTLPESRTL